MRSREQELECRCQKLIASGWRSGVEHLILQTKLVSVVCSFWSNDLSYKCFCLSPACWWDPLVSFGVCCSCGALRTVMGSVITGEAVLKIGAVKSQKKIEAVQLFCTSGGCV